MISVASGDRKSHHKWKCQKLSDEKYYAGKLFEVTNLTNNVTQIVDNMCEFSKLNCLDSKRMYEVSRGLHYCHKGWTCKAITNNDKPL